MFRKTRWKIVAAIMSVLVLIWVGTLVVIYGSSYYEVSNRNRKMLAEHAQMYLLESDLDDRMAGPDAKNTLPQQLLDDSMPEPLLNPAFPDNIPKPDPGAPHFENTPAFQLSTFTPSPFQRKGRFLQSTIVQVRFMKMKNWKNSPMR